MLALWAVVVCGAVLTSGRALVAQSTDHVAGVHESTNSSSGIVSFWPNRGRWNVGAQVAFALENDIPRNISHIAMLVAQPHVSLIVKEFQPSWFPASRFSLTSEGILGAAIHPGGHMIGHALLFRFDGRPRGRLVPFFDLGAGVLHTGTSVPELGGSVQFTPQGGPGVLYFFSPQRAVVFEYRYMHMSNAGIESPNRGFNASMLSIGLLWLRRPRPLGCQPSDHSHNLLRHFFRAR